MEIRYEKIIQAPRQVLSELSEFVDVPLDEEWVRSASKAVVPKKTGIAGNERSLAALNEQQQLLMEQLGYELP